MSDLVPLDWWERLDERGDTAFYAATFGIATALVQEGATGVTIVVPRAPGLVLRARAAARAAGITVRADQIASATLTLRFSGAPSHIQHEASRCSAPQRPMKRWTRLLRWLRVRARGPAAESR